jgi:ABC-type oligopeptide transport system substrate-binding subunit
MSKYFFLFFFIFPFNIKASFQFYSLEDITSLELPHCDNPYCSSLLKLITRSPFLVTKSGKIQKDALQDYSVKRGGREHHLRFRSDLFWSNGEIIQLDDYHRSIQRLQDSRMASPFQFVLKLQKFQKIWIENNELVLLTENPTPFLPYFLSLPCFGPTHSNNSQLFSGDYVLTKFNLSQNKFEFEPHPYQIERSFSEKLFLKGVLHTNTLLTAFEGSQADWISLTRPVDLERALKKFHPVQVSTLGWLYLSLNHSSGQFFSQKSARKALGSLFHPQFRRKLLFSPFPSNLPWILNSSFLVKSPIAPLKPLRFILRNEGILKEIGMTIAHEIETKLKWPIQIDSKPFPQDLKETIKRKFDLTLNVYRPDFGLPFEFFLIFSHLSHFNHGHVADSNYDALLLSYLESPSLETLDALKAYSQDLIPAIPIGDLSLYSLKKNLPFLSFPNFGALFRID